MKWTHERLATHLADILAEDFEGIETVTEVDENLRGGSFFDVYCTDGTVLTVKVQGVQ